MASPSFDTFSAVRALEAAGVERSQAETIASAIAHTDELATKQDIRALKSDFSGLRSEFKTDLANLEARMYRALWIQGGAIVAIVTALKLLE
ncbi:MAG: hypothetical protein OXC25_09700 [Thiotrichales bacterium]|nr:hypothetical protein [Thiotrichales bacterium]